MPTFISDEGVWVPAKEKVALEKVNPETGEKEPYIYEGQDRAALEMLKEMDMEEQGFMGVHFSENMELYELARGRGYNSVEEYVEKLGYNANKAKELVAKYKSKYVTHAAPEKVKGKEFAGGGVNTAGTGNDLSGGFGDLPK
jgi:hypothetical protein